MQCLLPTFLSAQTPLEYERRQRQTILTNEVTTSTDTSRENVENSIVFTKRYNKHRLGIKRERSVHYIIQFIRCLPYF